MKAVLMGYERRWFAIFVVTLTSVAADAPSRGDEAASTKEPSDPLAAYRTRNGESYPPLPDDPESTETLFSHLDKPELRKLIVHDSDQVSIRAAWELVLRDSPIEENTDEFSRIKRRSAQRFIGFVEGRLRIDLPKWWEQALQRGKRWAEGVGFSKLEPPPQWDLSSGIWFDSSQIKSLEFETLTDITIAAATDDVRMTLSREELSAFPPGNDRVNMAVSDSVVVIESHSYACMRYPIRCFERDSLKLRWRQSVWVSYASGGSGPPLGNHFTEIKLTPETVYVIGIGEGAAYVEEFRLTDGLPLLRFSTAY